MYSPRFTESVRKDSPVEEVPTSQKKTNRRRQPASVKKTNQNAEESRCVSWTTHEEVALCISGKKEIALTNAKEILLCKGWVYVSENSRVGNTRKDVRFWSEVLQYMVRKTKQYGHRTYYMVNEKWEMVRPVVVRFYGVYGNIMRRLQESGASDEDYYTMALVDYEAETGTTFKLRSGKRYKTSGSSSFNTESKEASINMNVDVGDDEEDEVQEIRRPISRDKAKDVAKKKWIERIRIVNLLFCFRFVALFCEGVEVRASDNRGVGRSYIPAKTSKYITLYRAETSAHDWNLFSYHLLVLHSHTKPMRMSFVIEIRNENENWNGKHEGVSKHKALQDILESSKEYLRRLATTHMIIPQIKAFLVIADVLEIYMQEFWATATVHHHSIRFKMDNKKHIINLESFRDMLHICPRLPGQSFVEPPFEEEILSFLCFLDTVEHKDTKKNNEMYYPRFTKVIIHHFMSKDSSIPRRNKVNWHYVRDDHMFTTIKLTHIYQASGSGADEGTGTIPEVPDVPTDDFEEDIYWKSIDD
nr:hypothetical protein [Tanacetum cinerariifolium]